MHSTVTITGTTARITPHGEIDSASLPLLRADRAALPPEVTELTWDLRHVSFMDSAGLYLLTDPRPDTEGPQPVTRAIGLTEQPCQFLTLAQDLFPHLGLDRLLHTTLPRQRTA